MRSPHFLAFSCGASHLGSVHLKMNASGRCDLIGFERRSVDFSSSDPLLWLKALSAELSPPARERHSDIPVGYTLPGHVFLAKYLRIPQVAPAKRQRIVEFEVRQNIPYSFNEVTWGHSIVEEDDLDFNVFIGAVRTEIVEAIRNYSQEARLNMRSIEPSTTALLNGFRFNYPEVDGCTLILSIGCKSTELVFVDSKRFQSRSVPFGGQTLSVEIAEKLGVPVAEGERVKLAAISGEPLSTEEYAAFGTAKQHFFSRLHTEIVRTKAVMQRQGYTFVASSCLLTGGGAILPGFVDSLAEKLDIPVSKFDPLKNIHIPNEGLREEAAEQSMFLADAVGHALGKFLPDAASIDLMPRSLVWQRKFRRQQPFYLVAGLVACAAVGLPIFNTILKINSYRQEIDNLDAQIRPLSQLNSSIHDRESQIVKIANVIEEVGKASELRTSWVSLLSDFQGRLIKVEDVWLDKLELVWPQAPANVGKGQVRISQTDDRLTLKLEGRLIDVKNPMSSVSEDSYQRVKVLLESFRKSSYVAALENERFDYSIPGMLRFDFTLVINPEVRL